MNNIVYLEKILKNLEDGISSAMVILTSNKGSIPGKKGAIMLVTEAEVLGTIGGGRIEFEIIEKAKECIKNDKSEDFVSSFSSKNGLACGGETTGFIKVFSPQKKLIIFGSGHVGRQIALAAKNLDFEIIVVDDREEYKTLPEFEHVTYYSCTNNEVKEKINLKNSYIIVTTRGHKLDEEVLEVVLNNNAAYIGMIGSRSKVNTVFNSLKEKGYSEELLSSVYSPIGLKIDNGTPEEIAFSILSQVLMIKNKLDGNSLSI
ncbi:MAG: XdhC family protein [Lachnospirales bacterium]